MINISAHGVTSIIASPIQEYNGTVWRTIFITSKDGVFKIDIFPNEQKQDQLAIIGVAAAEYENH